MLDPRNRQLHPTYVGMVDDGLAQAFAVEACPDQPIDRLAVLCQFAAALANGIHREAHAFRRDEHPGG